MVKKGMVKTGLIMAMVVLMAGFSTTAFAWAGMGGHGGCLMAKGGSDGCPMANMTGLSPEDVKKLEDERAAFFNETGDLRQKLTEKQDELKLEFSNKEVDVEKAKAVQKEISDLEAQFDQKRIEHMVRMKTLVPDFTPGCLGHGCKGGMGGGKGMGKGEGMGKEMNKNCPFMKQ
jgi:hypothetical protein